MAKQVIRLTESDLHNMIMESVYRTLTENEEDEGLWNGLKTAGNMLAKGAKAAYQGGKNMAQNVGNAIGNAAQNVANQAKQTYDNYQQQSACQSNINDLQKALQVIQDLSKNGLMKQNIANMAIGSINKTIQAKQQEQTNLKAQNKI